MKKDRIGIRNAQTAPAPDFVTVGEGALARRIAYLRREAQGAGAARPGVVWLGGFGSNMRGVKATRLDRSAAEAGRGFLRFDYFGHGQSEGRFEAGTIGKWLEDALAILRRLTEGPQVLVGSSMGGWLALLAARELHASGETERLRGLVLIAPAVDFTERLRDEMPEAARAELASEGVWRRPSAYAPEPYSIGRSLLEEGRRHLLFETTIRSHCPVHILQGMRDADVPWSQALRLVEHLAADPVILTLVKDGDHRLSREGDLEKLWQAVEAMG